MIQVVCKLEDCPNFMQPMKCQIEYDVAWQFQCPVCRNVRVVTKDKVGGTVGAGVRPDGPRAVGKGF